MKKWVIMLLLGPLFPLPAAALSAVTTSNAYMVENTSGTNSCYFFNTTGPGHCTANIVGLTATISTGSIPSGSTNYIQNASSPTIATQIFNVSTGTFTTAILQSGSVGTSGQFLGSNGIGSPPTWKTATGTVPTVQKFLSGSGTYTTPTSPVPLYIEIKMIAGGGGGAGGGTGAGTTAGDGGVTTFGTALLVSSGGIHGVFSGNGGVGGTATLGSGPIGISLSGGSGGGASLDTSGLTDFTAGGMGAASPFGGAGGAGAGNQAGQAAITNSGSGGGGGGSASASTAAGGGAGGAGGFFDAIINSPTTSYSYAVGIAGSAGGAGASGNAGGAGGSGLIEVIEHYQ